jgi:YHS domain-containing protein
MTQELVRDPVCGMEFGPGEAATTVEYEGRTYYFCCHACRVSFEAEPRRFVRREEKDK